MKTKTENPTHSLRSKLDKLGYRIDLSIQYQGKVFTLVCAAATKTDDPHQRIEAEGLSRRSVQDKPDLNRGRQIAEGRALKALWLKANGIKDLHGHHLLFG